MKVDPKKLLLTAIAAGSDETIEEGYHLRWLTGPELKFPDSAFPHRDVLEKFVNAKSPKDLDMPKDQKGNPVVPPAYFIYRRVHPEKHQTNLDHCISLISFTIRLLLSRLLPSTESLGVRFSIERTLKVKEPDYGPIVATARTFLIKYACRIAPALGGLLWQKNLPVLVASFPKTLHYLEVECKWDNLVTPPDLTMKYYADDKPEPVGERLFNWQRESGLLRRYAASLKIENNGHFDALRFFSKDLNGLTVSLRYQYMDEDTKIAQDPDKPAEGEWVLINSIPFITAFSTWETARDFHFNHLVKNRYLDFSIPTQASDMALLIAKLDMKYRDMFSKLQQRFLELKYFEILNSENQSIKNFSKSIPNRLVRFDYKPYFLFQLFSIDPINATLLGLKYNDAPGDHNPTPPTPRETYDYMVATAWQKPNDRLCYITQNVSPRIVPAISSIEGLKGKQEEGLTWKGRTVLCRAGLDWDIAERNDRQLPPLKPVVFDVWRGDVPDFSLGNCISLYYDEDAAEKVIDSPVVVSRSFKFPATEQERAHYSIEQLNAVDLDRAIMVRDTSFTITKSHVLAYEKMKQIGLHRFFNIGEHSALEPPIKFNEWLSIVEKEKTVFYRVRGVDIFGRYTKYSNPVKVTLSRPYPPPEVVKVMAWLVPAANDKNDLYVTWRLGPYQERAGQIVNHFNVVHKKIEMALRVRTFNAAPNPAVPNSSSEWRKFGNHWTPLNDAVIPRRDPISINIEKMDRLEGGHLTGKIIGCNLCTPQNLVTETNGASIRYSEYESKLIQGTRLELTTDQCYLGIPPFVDIPNRYEQSYYGYGNLSIDDIELDDLQLFIGEDATPYTVYGFAGGQSLKLTIAYDGDFFAKNGDNPPFILRFNKFKTIIEWTEEIARNNSFFPDLIVDSNIGADQQREAIRKYFLDSRTVRLHVPKNIAPEITGRERWITEGALLEYRYPANGGIVYRFPINGHSTWIDEDRPYHDGPPNRRIFLKDITLTKIIYDAEQGSDVPNPITPFPRDMIEELLQGNSVELNFRMAMPPVVKAITDRLDDGSGPSNRLVSSPGGDVSFEGKDNVLNVCEVITRPSPTNDGNKISFLLKADTQFPNKSQHNELGMRFVLPPNEVQFHDVYVAQISDIRSHFSEAQEECVNRCIAVSTHQDLTGNIPDQYSNLDKENLVSSTVDITLPPKSPTTLNFGLPIIQQPFPDPFPDPFTDYYSTLPKLLDGKKVVQFEIDLSNVQMLGGIDLNVTLTVGDSVELFRAPEDGLRAMMKKPGDPTVQDFNTKTLEEYRKIVITRLVNDWDNGFSLQSAFTPIAKLNGPGTFTDQIDGIAAGRIYYALRLNRTYGAGAVKGVASGEMVLLPFRVNIVDTTPPAPPQIKVLYEDGKATIRWSATTEPDVFCYEIYRSDNSTTSKTPRGNLIKRLYLSQGGIGADPIGALIQHAPLMLKPMKMQLVVRKTSNVNLGSINLIFPLDIIGIPDKTNIVGIYKTNDLPSIQDLPTHDFGNDPNNHRDGAHISIDKRSIIDIDLENKDEVAIVYLDSSGSHKILRSIDYHSLLLEGIPQDKLSNINGIFPKAQMKVSNKKVFLIFDDSIHGISSADKILGVYRLIPEEGEPPSGTGYGTLNHWKNKWPGGEPNDEKKFSADKRTIEGINLPNGTEIIIEYEDAVGTTQTLKEILSDNHPALSDISENGLLPGKLATDAINDPARIAHEIDANGNRSRNFKMKISEPFSAQLNSVFPVTVRFGTTRQDFDNGTQEVLFIDRYLAHSSQPVYSAVAVRIITTGPSSADGNKVRSVFGHK